MEEEKIITKEGKDFYSIFAEVSDYDRPLVQTHLTFARLIDDIVLPFEEDKPFFIDGAPIKKKDIRKLKILRQKADVFDTAFYDLLWGMRSFKESLQKIYGEQYHIRLEAALREGCEDVTSQVIKAFDARIKPSLKDYLTKKPELISSAYQFLLASLKLLGE